MFAILEVEMKRTVIANKKRFYSFLVLAALFLGLGLSLFFASLTNATAFGAGEEQMEEWLVQSGDTVWSIACPLAQERGQDVRDLVRDIYRWNDLKDKTIHPGQTLRLPLH